LTDAAPKPTASSGDASSKPDGIPSLAVDVGSPAGEYLTDVWLPAHRRVVRPNTWANYELMVQAHLLPAPISRQIRIEIETPKEVTTQQRDRIIETVVTETLRHTNKT